MKDWIWDGTDSHRLDPDWRYTHADLDGETYEVKWIGRCGWLEKNGEVAWKVRPQHSIRLYEGE